MAVFGDNPEFGKELNEAAKTFSDASGIAKNSIKDLNKQIEDLNITQADNIEKQKGLNEELENSELPEFSKEIIALKENIKMLANDIEESSVKIKSLKEEKQSAKDDLDNAALGMFQSMNANIFKISEAELERRKEFDRNMKVSKEGLEEMKRLKPEAATDIDAKLGSTIKKQEKDEQKRRDNQQTNIFKKGFEFIGNKFEDIKKSGVTALKTGLFIAAYFALAKFLQSETFVKMVDFIYKVIIPNLKEIGIVIGVLAGLLLVSKIATVISTIGTVFSVMKVVFIAIAAALKLAFVIPLAIIMAKVALVALIFGGIVVGFRAFQKTLEETGSIGEAMSAAVASAIGFIVGLPFDLLFKLTGFIAGIFGFDNFKAELAKLDPVGDVTKSLKNLFANIGDFFTRFVAGAKAFIGAMVKGLFTGESPMEAFDRAYDAKSNNADDDERLSKAGEGSLGTKEQLKLIKKDPNSITIDEALKRQTDQMQSNQTIVSNTTVNNGTGDTNNSFASRGSKDESNEYAMQN